MAPSRANATTITYYLTQDACTGNLWTVRFGTIVLDDALAGEPAEHRSTSFSDLDGRRNVRWDRRRPGSFVQHCRRPAISITDITSGFALGPAPATASAFGTFDYSITCVLCQGGNAGNPDLTAHVRRHAHRHHIVEFRCQRRRLLLRVRHRWLEREHGERCRDRRSHASARAGLASAARFRFGVPVSQMRRQARPSR